MPRRPPSALTAVALATAVAALVALASRGTPVWALVRDGRPDRAGVLALVAVVAVLVGAVGLVLAIVVHRAILARRAGAPPLRSTLLRALPIGIAAIALASLLAIAESDLWAGGSTDARPAHVPIESGRPGRFLNISGWFNAAGRAGEDQRDEEGLVPTERDPGPSMPSLLIIAGVVLVAIAGAAAWRLRAGRLGSVPVELRGDEDSSGPDREAVHGAVVGTIDGMLADPDPNTAIIGAYARLLEGLAACGSERRSHEAPMEHIHRVLRVRQVRPEPLRELIGLFEVARFSTHALDASHRDRALEALRAVATDLAPAGFAEGAAEARRTVGSRP